MIRLDALTGVRILAATAVFLSHIPAVPGAPDVIRTFMSAGYMGVTLFFILSGFILTWNYESRLGARFEPRSILNFFVARFARIYPMYLFALLVVVAFQVVGNESWSSVFTSGAFWVHVAALQPWSPNHSVAFAFNSPAWSIGVEVFLYALFPLLILGVSRLRRRKWNATVVLVFCALASLALSAWFQIAGWADLEWTDPQSDHRWLYRNPATRVFDFVAGMCAAVIVGQTRDLAMRGWGALAQVTGVLVTVGIMASPAMLYSAASWDAAYILPAALVIVGLVWAPRTWFARLLATPLVVLLGEASFAFYLLHVIVIENFPRFGSGGLAAWAGSALALYAIATCLAVGAHILIEKPARTRIRNLFNRSRGRTGSAANIPSTSLRIDAIPSALGTPTGRPRRGSDEDGS